MRIIIEVEPGASQAVVETETAALGTEQPQAIDGGPPPQYLLDALSEAAGGATAEDSDVGTISKDDQAQDAGGVPEWLVDSVESAQRIESAR